MTMLAEAPTARCDTAVCPRAASVAVAMGEPLVVDVADFGSGWFIVDVGEDTFTVYRDRREMPVPHTAVRLP